MVLAFIILACENKPSLDIAIHTSLQNCSAVILILLSKRWSIINEGALITLGKRKLFLYDLYIFRNATRHAIIDIDAKRELCGFKFCKLISETGKITCPGYIFIYYYSRKIWKLNRRNKTVFQAANWAICRIETCETN